MTYSLEIPRVFHRVWLGESEIPEEFEHYWAKWEALHPGWEMKTWREEDLAWLKNRREFEAPGPFSGKANIARYEIVHREGGVYVDTDFEPLANLEPMLAGVRFIAAEERPGLLNNAFFGAIPGHPILRYVIEELPSSFWGNEGEISPQRSGPNFLTRCVRRASRPDDATVRIASREEFYPYSYEQTDLSHVTADRAVAVHHWAKSWVPPSGFRKPSARNAAGSMVRAGLGRVKHVAARAQRVWGSVEPKSQRVADPLRAAFVGNNQMLVLLEDRFPLYCFADDLGVTPSLVLAGSYEPHYQRFLERVLRPGDVAVDVGANIGVFAVPMAHAVGANGRVYCYEPQPSTFALLERSFYANRMRGLAAEVILRNAAAGEEPGRTVLTSPTQHPGRSSTVAEALRDLQSGTQQFDVPLVRLDDELGGNPEIRLMKIDVEGGELAVLRGAARMIRERRVRFIDIELVDAHLGERWDEMVEHLRLLCRRDGATTSVVTGEGTLAPIELDRAVHSERIQHLVIHFAEA